VHVSQLPGDGNGMGNKGLAGHACLALMGVGTIFVCVHDLFDLLGGHIGLEHFEQLPKTTVTS
jgi:hypothetical protein